MKHLSFQLVDLKDAFDFMNSQRYSTMYGSYQIEDPITEPGLVDYDNEEHILNRINQKLIFGCQLGYGCCIGIAFRVSPQVYNSINDPSVYSSNQFTETDEENSLYFIGGELKHLQNDTSVRLPLNKFSISKNSFLLKGANIQLG